MACQFGDWKQVHVLTNKKHTFRMQKTPLIRFIKKVYTKNKINKEQYM